VTTDRKPSAATPRPQEPGPLALAGDVLLALLALAPLAVTTVESIQSGARLRWPLLVLLVVHIGAFAALWKSVGPRLLAGVAAIGFAGLVSGATLLPHGGGPALALLGRAEGFWASAAALVSLIAFAALVASALPPKAWVAPIAAVAVLGAGYGLAMARARPLGELYAGATLAGLPGVLQPATISRYALPACALIAILMACVALGGRHAGRAWAGLAVAVLLAFPSGAAHLAAKRGPSPTTTPDPTPAPTRRGSTRHAHASPSPSPSAAAEASSTVGEGELRFSYLSPWEHNQAGGMDHDVVVRTRGFKVGRPSELQMASLVRAPASAADTCRVLLRCRAPDGKVRALTAEDVEVYEDGQKIEAPSITRRASRDAHVYFVGMMHGREDAYREKVNLAISKMVAALPEATKASVSYWSTWNHYLEELDSRDPKKIFDKLYNRLFYSHSDFEAHQMTMKLVTQLELLGRRDPDRFFVAVQERTISKEPAPVTSSVPELRKTGTPVLTIGGPADGHMGELARALGGVHAVGEHVDEWSKGLDALRQAIDYDYTITFRRKRQPPPPIEIELPARDAVVKGPMKIKVKAPKGDPFGVEIAMNDVPLKTINAPPFEMTADVSPFADGRNELRATPLSASGERGTTATVPITIEHDAPHLVCKGLPDGERVTEPVTIEVTSRGQALATLAVWLDGKPLMTLKQPWTPPAKVPLDPSKLADGAHEVKIEGVSTGGRKALATLSFASQRRGVELEVTSPTPSSKIFGRVQIWVKPKPNWAQGTVTKMEAFVTGGLVADHKVGEVTAAPWLVPWPTGEFAAGAYTIKAVVHTNDSKTTGTVTIPVEVTRPTFAVEITSPRSGETITGPVPIEISIKDESSLGLDRVEFSAGGKVIEKKIQAPWTSTLDPTALEEGLVRIAVTAYRKDDAAATATATVLSRRLQPVFVPVLATNASGPVPPSLLLAQKPQVTLARAAPRSARFVSARKAGVHMVVVFPASQFTSDDGNLQPTLDALARFVRAARSSMAVGLVRYADSVRSAAEPLTPLESLLDCLKVPYPKPGRVLHDGMVAGAMALGGASGRKLLVLIVDGPDANAARTGAGSKHAGSEAVKLIRHEDIEVHIIGFGRDLKLAQNLGPSLKKLALLTGGSAHGLPGAASLPAALDAVKAHTDGQVLLEIVPTVEQLKPGLHPLSVTLPGEAGVTLHHRGAVSVR
jgi:hypothetical protein